MGSLSFLSGRGSSFWCSLLSQRNEMKNYLLLLAVVATYVSAEPQFPFGLTPGFPLPLIFNSPPVYYHKVAGDQEKGLEKTPDFYHKIEGEEFGEEGLHPDHCYPTLQLTGQACLVAATMRPHVDIATAQTNTGATETAIGNTTNARTKRRVVLRKRCWLPPTSTGAAMGRASSLWTAS